MFSKVYDPANKLGNSDHSFGLINKKEISSFEKSQTDNGT